MAWMFKKVLDFLLLVFIVWGNHKNWSSYPDLQLCSHSEGLLLEEAHFLMRCR